MRLFARRPASSAGRPEPANNSRLSFVRAQTRRRPTALVTLAAHEEGRELQLLSPLASVFVAVKSRLLASEECRQGALLLRLLPQQLVTAGSGLGRLNAPTGEEVVAPGRFVYVSGAFAAQKFKL